MFTEEWFIAVSYTHLDVYKRQAVHCTLNIDDCSEVACEKFKELVENCNELNMELIEEGDISVVNLYSNKCDIKQSLLTLCHELSEDESSGNTDAIPLSVLVGNEEISSSDFEIGFISYGNTPSDFYIHRNGVENVLDDLMEKLSAVNLSLIHISSRVG